MAANGKLLSVIGDEETVVGFLLAGIGKLQLQQLRRSRGEEDEEA